MSGNVLNFPTLMNLVWWHHPLCWCHQTIMNLGVYRNGQDFGPSSHTEGVAKHKDRGIFLALAKMQLFSELYSY